MIAGSGPGRLYLDDTLELLTAYVYGIDSTTFTFPLGVQNLFDNATEIRNAYMDNLLGCGSSFDPYVAGINVIKTEDRIKVYPNPFNYSIKIDGVSSDAVVRISDINGKLIFEIKIQNNEEIQLDWLTNGVFVMRIINGNNIFTKRIVKM
jgi:hypothetical protein